jgi:hypothetical protein
MSDLVITVQGSHTARVRAEHAIVRARAAFDGPDREAVLTRASKLADEMSDALRALEDEERGPVLRWDGDGVQVWSDRPWNDQGAQLPLVHHAAIGVRAVFVDPDPLARWVEEFGGREGATVDGVEWRLSPETERRALDDARAEAVADAVAKAGSYAASLGRGAVTAVAIADPGMLDPAGPGGGGFGFGFGDAPVPAARAAKFDASGGGALELTPGEVEVTVRVDARFGAS